MSYNDFCISWHEIARAYTRVVNYSDNSKFCSGCNTHLSKESFYKCRGAADGLNWRCKTCSKKYNNQYRRNKQLTDPEWAELRRTRQAERLRVSPVNSRSFRFRCYRYRAAPEEIISMWCDQEGKCAICGKNFPETVLEPESDMPREVHIDHDHDSGKVRGLLCVGCNTGLGQLERLIRVGGAATLLNYLGY